MRCGGSGWGQGHPACGRHFSEARLVFRAPYLAAASFPSPVCALPPGRDAGGFTELPFPGISRFLGKREADPNADKTGRLGKLGNVPSVTTSLWESSQGGQPLRFAQDEVFFQGWQK